MSEKYIGKINGASGGSVEEKERQQLRSRPSIKELSKGINRRIVRNEVTVIYSRTETVLT